MSDTRRVLRPTHDYAQRPVENTDGLPVSLRSSQVDRYTPVQTPCSAITKTKRDPYPSACETLRVDPVRAAFTTTAGDEQPPLERKRRCRPVREQATQDGIRDDPRRDRLATIQTGRLCGLQDQVHESLSELCVLL